MLLALDVSMSSDKHVVLQDWQCFIASATRRRSQQGRTRFELQMCSSHAVLGLGEFGAGIVLAIIERMPTMLEPADRANHESYTSSCPSCFAVPRCTLSRCNSFSESSIQITCISTSQSANSYLLIGLRLVMLFPFAFTSQEPARTRCIFLWLLIRGVARTTFGRECTTCERTAV